MSIRSYVENGTTYYEVRVSIRSKQDRSIRVQKLKSGLSDLKLARKTEKKLREDALRAVIEKELAELSWGALVGQWELALRDGSEVSTVVGRTTVEDYIQALQTHTQSWWKLQASEITRADVRACYKEIADQGLSKSVADKLRSAINGLFDWGIESRRIKSVDESPAIGIPTRPGRQEEKRPEILTMKQIRQLLEHARVYDQNWYWVWSAALLTGMRAGELCALRWDDIDLDTKLIHVRRSTNKRSGSEGPTKGRYWRDVPVNGELETLLLELRRTQKGPYVLPRIRELMKGEQARVIRDFSSSLGLPSIKFHTLRACFATQLLKAGVSIPIVMLIGGWKSMKTMQRYIRLSGLEIQGATEGLKIIPPREAVKVVSIFGNKDPG